jgi:putative FmdB family regulatory protein
MPIYEYECKSCGDRFERRQSFTDEPIKTCPVCSGPTRKVLQPVGIVFKGSGWYVNDSRPRSASESAESKGDAKPETKADAKADTKAEQKSESKSESKAESAATKTEPTKPPAASQPAK